MIVIGIDYSLTNPCICIANSDLNTDFANTSVHYLTDTNKYTGDFGNITGTLHKTYSCQEERHENNTMWVLDHINTNVETKVYLEGYSMGSKGKVFNIAENAGLLKYHVWKLGIPLITVPPTTNKKFFSGKGNSDKDKMEEAFRTKTGVDLYQVFGFDRTTKVLSPYNDIVDAYALAQYGLQFELLPEGGTPHYITNQIAVK